MNKIFIKSPNKINKDFSYDSPAYRFRRKFSLSSFKHAEIFVCGLGYGYYYLNESLLSEDKFTAPVSDYRKTIWYNKYDCTSLLKIGENIFCAYLGNGFLNENFKTGWGHNEASWRDNPKLFVSLIVDGNVIFSSDYLFKVKEDKVIYFNQLRSGEYWNYNFSENWKSINFDDSNWDKPIIDDKKMGELTQCKSEPIREFETYKPIEIIEKDDKRIYVFENNLSGYLRIKGKLNRNQKITIQHVEVVDDNFNIMLNDEDLINHINVFQKPIPFQTDIIISDGNYFEWSPLFTYHGFKYAVISGLEKDDNIDVQQIYVHEALKRSSSFNSSSEILNKIYKCGINSTYSNMYYSLTDCPTREKLGWLNDSNASIGQVLINFDSELFFRKWLVDIVDSIKNDGEVPGIAPSNDWGYNFGAPCTIAFVTIPYKLFLKTQDINILLNSLPYIIKVFDFYDKKIWSNDSKFILGDWTGTRNKETPKAFIEKLIGLRFLRILILINTILKIDNTLYLKKEQSYINYINDNYLDNGSCIYNTYTSISMLIIEELGDFEKLKNQLISIYYLKKEIDTGMVGTQYLYDAFTKIGRSDLVLDLITNDNSFFKKWIDKGATTLFESFDTNPHTLSLNHHMFSNVLEWFYTGLLGINFDKIEGFNKITILPNKNINISFIEGSINFNDGSLYVSIKDGSELTINVSGNINVYYLNNKLMNNNKFKI